MKTILIATVCAVALSGCATADKQAILKNLEGCARHYNGVVAAGGLGAPGFSGSVKIDCDPQPVAPSLSVGATVGAAPVT